MTHQHEPRTIGHGIALASNCAGCGKTARVWNCAGKPKTCGRSWCDECVPSHPISVDGASIALRPMHRLPLAVTFHPTVELVGPHEDGKSWRVVLGMPDSDVSLDVRVPFDRLDTARESGEWEMRELIAQCATDQLVVELERAGAWAQVPDCRRFEEQLRDFLREDNRAMVPPMELLCEYIPLLKRRASQAEEQLAALRKLHPEG